MGAGGPLSFGDVQSPPLPAQQRLQGGGELFSYQGQPYWLDSGGQLWALTSTGVSAVAWALGAGGGEYLPLAGGTVTGQFSRTAFNWWSLDSFAGTDDQKMTSAIAPVAGAGPPPPARGSSAAPRSTGGRWTRSPAPTTRR